MDFKLFFDENSSVMLLINPDNGEIIEANKSAKNFYGYKNLTTMSINDINTLPPETLKEKREDAFKKTQNFFIFDHKLASGEIRTVEVNTSKITMDNKEILFSIIHDITHKIELENRVKKQHEQEKLLKERYKSIIENMSNGIIILKPHQKNFTIIELNKVAIEIDHLNEKKTLGKNIVEIFPNIKNNGLLDVIRRVSNTGHAESTPLTFYNDRDISEWREYYIFKLSSDEIVLLYKDNTPQKLLEKELKKSEQLKKDILNTLPLMTWVKDLEGVYLGCNNKFEEYFGAKEKDIIGHTDYDFVNPLTAKIFRNNDIIAIAKDKAHTNEEWITYPNGERKLLKTTKVPLKDEENKSFGIVGIGVDITQESQQLEGLKLYSSIFINTKEAILVTDAEGKIIKINDAFTAITGYYEDEVLGRKPNILKSGKHDQKFYKYMWEDIKLYGFWSGEIINKRKNGNLFTELLTISSVKDKHDKDKFYVALFNDISLIKQNEKDLKALAHFDALTSLPNRVLLLDRIQQAIYTSKRTLIPFALAFLDLDGFKTVNDEYGHNIGDALLIHISKTLQDMVRESDTVSRLGGDEFILVFSNLNDEDPIENFCERILKKISDPLKIQNHTINISASIGVVIHNIARTYTPEFLIREADKAMYDAKNSGKNKVIIHHL